MGLFNFWRKKHKVKITGESPKGNTKGSKIYHLVEQSRQKDGSVLTMDHGDFTKEQLNSFKKERLKELNSGAKKLQKDLMKIDKNINGLIELRDEILTKIQENNKKVREYGRI
jgi:hypothetical protein